MGGSRSSNDYLYDDILPPLVDNSYRMTIQTNVMINNWPASIRKNRSSTSEEFHGSPASGRRRGRFPPRNGNGPFDGVIPQIAMYWHAAGSERSTPRTRSGTPTTNSDISALSKDGLPWVALFVFEEGEYALLENQPLERICRKTVLARIGNPAGITCDAIEVSNSLLDAVLPSKEELQLFARQVNVNDRELNVATRTAFFLC